MKTKLNVLIAFLAFLGASFTANAQWNTTGNAGTDPAINFIGTSDNKSLTFKVNNAFSGSLSTGWTSFGVGAMPNGSGSNSAFGINALSANASSQGNSAFGAYSLRYTTSGNSNTALGVFAMSANMTGDSNIAIGFKSLLASVNGTKNIAIGFESMGGSTGNENIAIGYRAFQLSTASSNIGIGSNVFANLVSPATFNTAVGQDSGTYLSSGSNNSFFGRSAGRGTTNFNTGSSNSFFGYNSGIDISSGNFNSFFGTGSGAGLTTGTGNTFLGSVSVPNTTANATDAGNNTSNTVILADGIGNQKIYFHSNGFTGIGLGNNKIPSNTLEIKSYPYSPSLSGLRFTNLTNASASITNTTNKVLSVNASGDVILVDDKQGTGGAITNTLGSSVNTMTSTVNGTVATAPIVNSVVNTIASGQLTTTVNGVASAPVTLPAGGIDTDAQTLTVSGDQLTISNGNTVTLPSLTEVDGSTTNELSNLSLTGNVLTLTNPLTPGNSVTLPSLTEIDGDVTNELQTLGLNGNVLSISNGNTVTLPAYTDTDAQTLSLTGNVLSISNGNNVTLPITVANGSETIIQAGTNVTVTGQGTITSPYVINSTATGGADINIYEHNGTLTGNRTMLMNNNNLIFNSTSNTGGKIYIGNVTAFNATNFPTTTGNYKLYVEGGILTEKVKVALTGTANWADYVFANDYKLMPLSEVESFVKTNKHLPGISSAENLVKEGLDLGAMQAKQMQKIEELTLYAIEQNKTIEKQSKEIEELKVLVNALVNKNK